MNHCVKCSRFLKPGAPDSLDRISTLPDELLGYMLSFLPTKYAVRTSVLSSRWRCLHMLTNCLSFNALSGYYGHKEEDEKSHKKCFKKFVNRVLLFHKVSPIKYFHLSCGKHVYDDLHLHNWITVAVLKGVEQLHLSFIGESKPLPLCLFTSQTIVELQIHSRISKFQVPDTAHLPSLKILDLRGIGFSNPHSFDMLLSACPLLQELKIELCTWSPDSLSDCNVCLSLGELRHLTINCCLGRFEVDAPSLINLVLVTIYKVCVPLSLKNADNLAKARLNFNDRVFEDDLDLRDASVTFYHDVAALIKAVYHVKELHLQSYTMQCLASSQEDHMPRYPNLLKLSLGRCSYDAWKYVVHWLGHSPRLQTLIFEQGLVLDGPNIREEEWPQNVPLPPFSSRLKVIEAALFRGYTAELALVKYLLKNASLLKRLVLEQVTHSMTRKQERRANRRLLMFPRSSKTCVVRMKCRHRLL